MAEGMDERDDVPYLTAVLVLIAILAVFGTVIIWKKCRNPKIGQSMMNGESIQMISNGDNACPEWLKARKEMLFSSNHLERGDKLGNGNYGSVYKGKLCQGKAV